VSEPVSPLPVMPLVSVIFPGDTFPEGIGEALEEVFGEAVLESARYPFDLSDYYEAEMGCDLGRVWLGFRRLSDPSLLPSWKLACREIEKESSREGGNRTINVDPGYMDFGKLVLASFKEAPDKIYVGSGVWAHVCLRYGHGGFTAPSHSFPDFRDGRFLEFMLRARSTYKRLLHSR